MKMENIITYNFKPFANYPNVLKVGINQNTQKKDITGKKILVILDATGSMNERLNEKVQMNKMEMAKKVILSLINLNKDNKFDILPFNATPLDLVNYENIPNPNNCTYFTPLVGAVTPLLQTNQYSSVFFISDGLPSENRENALQAIRHIGTDSREYGLNTSSLAIGIDSDGYACGQFAGSYGVNCYIKYESQYEDVIEDLNNAINCNYVKVETGEYISVDDDNKFYYVTKDNNINNYSIVNLETAKNFVNLVISHELNKPESNNNTIREINKYVEIIKEFIKEPNEQTIFIEYYKEIFGDLQKQMQQFEKVNSKVSATVHAHRTMVKKMRREDDKI